MIHNIFNIPIFNRLQKIVNDQQLLILVTEYSLFSQSTTSTPPLVNIVKMIKMKYD